MMNESKDLGVDFISQFFYDIPQIAKTPGFWVVLLFILPFLLVLYAPVTRRMENNSVHS